MKLLEFAFDASKRIVKIAAALLQAVLNAVMALVQTLCRFLGVTPPPSMPQPFVPSTTAQDVRDEYAGFIHDGGRVRPCARQRSRQAVYQFAQALDPAIRGAVDLGGLSPSQIDWLLGLSEADLQRLARPGRGLASLRCADGNAASSDCRFRRRSARKSRDRRPSAIF